MPIPFYHYIIHGLKGVGWRGRGIRHNQPCSYDTYANSFTITLYTEEEWPSVFELYIYIVHRGGGGGAGPHQFIWCIYQFLHHIKLAELEGGGREMDQSPYPPSPTPSWLWPRGIKRGRDMGRRTQREWGMKGRETTFKSIYLRYTEGEGAGQNKSIWCIYQFLHIKLA